MQLVYIIVGVGRARRLSLNKANSAAQGWINAYSSGEGASWPSENLIRMAKGTYIPGQTNDWRGKRVLDVGCGNGNNLVLFGTLGAQLFGTEIEASISTLAENKLASVGFSSEVRVGTNREIPFDSGYFDCLVSWNVIHYETSDSNVRLGLREYARVLRPGGRLFLSTTGPRHDLIRGAERLGPRLRRIRHSSDFRNNELHYCLGDARTVKRFISPIFEEVYVGRTVTSLFTKTIDWFLVSAVKPR